VRRALAAGLAAGVAGLATAAGAHADTIRIGARPTSRPLPAGFLSLSLQYRTILRWTGPPDQPVDPVFVALVRNLDPSGRPVLRIGGQGGDRTWWPAPGLRRPLGVSDTLSPRFTRAARRLAAALPARLLLQINLEAGSVRLAQVEARRLLAGVGRADIAAFEIGNEPDLYTSQPWYWESGGRPLPWYAGRGTPVFARPAGYGPAQFLAEFARVARALPAGIPLAGPDLADPAWLDAVAGPLAGDPRVRVLDVHTYPVLRCETDPSSPRYPTVAHLLALGASRGLLAGARAEVALAHRHGDRFVDDELGADSCGGDAGVSDTLASALWVMDALFSLDRAGVDGVDLHNLPGAINGLFNLRRTGHRWRARIRPVYLGAVLFARAAPAGSRLVALRGGGPGRVRRWATLGPDGLLRVLLIDPGPAATVALRPPGRWARLPAAVQRLTARGGAGATGGLRLAGRAFSRTGTGILPAPRPQLARVHAGRVRVALPAASAALVTFTPRRAPSSARRETAFRR
jgi:hypothetical protein